MPTKLAVKIFQDHLVFACKSRFLLVIITTETLNGSRIFKSYFLFYEQGINIGYVP